MKNLELFMQEVARKLKDKGDKVISFLVIYMRYVLFIVSIFTLATSYGYAQRNSQENSGSGSGYGRLLYKNTSGKINYAVYSLGDAFADFWQQVKEIKVKNIAVKKRLSKNQLKKSKIEIKKLKEQLEQDYLTLSNQQYQVKYNQQYKVWTATIYQAGKRYWDFQVEKNLAFMYPLKESDVKKLIFERHLEVFKKQYPSDDFLARAKKAIKYIKYPLEKTFAFYGKQQDDVRVIIVPIDAEGVAVVGINQGEEATKIKHPQSIISLGINLLPNLNLLLSLIPREYTQRMNFLKGGLVMDKKKWISQGKMFWGLWSKGLATYGVRAVTRLRSLKYLLPYKEYASGKYKDDVDMNIDPWLAFMFLVEYNKPYFLPDKMGPLKMWFGNESRQLRGDLPPAIGYYLGYKVVRLVIEEFGYTFEQLLAFDYKRLAPLGIRALRVLMYRRP